MSRAQATKEFGRATAIVCGKQQSVEVEIAVGKRGGWVVSTCGHAKIGRLGSFNSVTHRKVGPPIRREGNLDLPSNDKPLTRPRLGTILGSVAFTHPYPILCLRIDFISLVIDRGLYSGVPTPNVGRASLSSCGCMPGWIQFVAGWLYETPC